MSQGIPPGCTGSAIGISLFTSSPDVHIGDTLFYSASVFNGLVGNPTSCDASNILASITTPDGVVHPITLRRTYLTHAQSDFYTNIVSYVVRAQDIRPDGSVRATAEVTAIIRQNDTPSTGGANQGVNTEVSQPCIQIAVQCVGGVGENGVINFTGTVTNCGNNTLVGVTVTNFVNGEQFQVTFITNLLRGQVATFSGSYVPANPCVPSTAVFTARGADQFTSNPRTVTSSANTTCQNTLTPAIQVTKVCPVTPVAPGELLIFSGTVRNTGNVTLTNIVVMNSQPAANTPVFTVASLAPGATASFNGSYLAPTNCSVADTLTATAASRCGVGVTSTASATCPILTTPAISVTVACPVAPTTPGGALVHNGTVRNTGNITLLNVVVVSDRPAANTTVFTVASLAPGASANFTSTQTVPANACAVTSLFSARGQDNCSPTLVTNSVSTTCTVVSTASIAVTLACPTVSATPGGLLTYTGTVRNSGNVTLNNVSVVNAQSSPSTVFTVASLAPGASANFTASFNAPADVCSVSSTVTASGADNCSGAVVANSASATCTLLTTPSLVVTQVCPVSPATPGSLLTYSGTVRNSGNITLTNVVVLNNLSGGTPVFTAATLAPGATASFTGSYLAPTNCSSTSISTASGRSICGVAVTNSASATCTILTTPQISVTVVCPVTPVVPGSLLTYTGTVRNTGDIALTNVLVVSDRPSANTTVFTVATLAPGASANFTGSYTVPAEPCSITAAIRATGGDCTGSVVTNTFLSTCTVVTAPAIAVTLTCPPVVTGTPVNVALGRTATQSSTYSFQGVSYVAGWAVDGNTSGLSGDRSISIADAAPNAWWQVDLGSVRNISTINIWSRLDGPAEQTSNLYVLVSDNPIPANLQTATNQAGVSVYYFPGSVARPTAFSINRTGRHVKVQLAGSGYLTLSEVQVFEPPVVAPTLSITYSGTVRNSGNVTLNNVSVVNNQSSPSTVFTVASLAPGASANFTANVTTLGDACTLSSTVIATGADNCSGLFVTNSATATCPVVTSPGIVVTQDCPVGPATPGSLLTYSGTVRNSGNITLTNVVVMNNQSGGTPVLTVASLAPGVTASFTGSYLAPTNCSSTSISTASGRSICGVAVSGTVSATCPILTTPAIVVTQTCPTTTVVPGSTLTYIGTVRNTGNVTLTNVIVRSDRPGDDTVVFTAAFLAPGAVTNFTGSYQVPLNCCVVSSTLAASGRDICTGATVSDTYTATCTVLTLPRISVTKVCPITIARPGDMLEYSGTVSNSGNITLVNVTLVNTQSGVGLPFFGPITLAPGESVSYDASFLVPPDFCGTDTVTARGLDACTFAAATSSVTTTCPVSTAPRISVIKNCPTDPVPKGGVFTFSGTVSNPGNVTLTNVYVFNSQPSNSTPVIGPITLAPGASVNFTGSYPAPTCCCVTVDTLTARGQDRCGGTTVTSSSTALCPLQTTPSITVTKVCPPTAVPVGGLFTYTGSVSNSGDIVLTNVFVTGNQPNAGAALLGPIELAPGESKTFSGSFIVPANMNPAIGTVTATGTDGCQARNVTATSDCSGPVGALSITSVTLANGVATVTWTSIPGVTYRVQSTTNMVNAVWSSLPGDVTATGNTATKNDTTPAWQRFYRILRP